MPSDTALFPFKYWHQLRDRLHDFIWPTEEEASEYRRVLRHMEEEESYHRGLADATKPSKRPRPPHLTCPCDMCRKYWEGFWSRV